MGVARHGVRLICDLPLAIARKERARTIVLGEPVGRIGHKTRRYMRGGAVADGSVGYGRGLPRASMRQRRFPAASALSSLLRKSLPKFQRPKFNIEDDVRAFIAVKLDIITDRLTLLLGQGLREGLKEIVPM